MGKNTYLYLLTLGRQCYEPQSTASNTTAPTSQSDPLQDDPNKSTNEAPPSSTSDDASNSTTNARGSTNTSPEAKQSIELQRALRRAQNDVLATIGNQLTEGSKSEKKAREELHAEQESENDVGLFLGGMDLAAMYFLTWPLIGLRNELQTFQGLDDASYLSLLRLVFRERTVLEWFAGIPAHIIYQIINVLREYFQSLLFRWLKKKKIFKDPVTNKPNRRVLNVLYKSLTIGAFFYIYPIYQHSVLQSLHLIPSYPILPPAKSFIPFYPLLKSHTSLKSLIKSIFSITTYINSPYFWSLIQQKAAFRVHVLFLGLLNRFLPRPNTFDKITTGGGFVIGEADYDEFFSDDEGSGDTTIILGESRDNLNQVNITAVNNASTVNLPETVLTLPPIDTSNPFSIDDETTQFTTQTFTASVTIETPTDDSSITIPIDTDSLEPQNTQLSPHPEIEVQITTSTHPSPTLSSTHIPIPEDSERLTAVVTPQRTTSRPQTRSSQPHYRSTQLSTHPTEILATHMADAVATTLTLGLESMVMRTNALSIFPSSPSSSTIPIPRSNILVLASTAGLLGLHNSWSLKTINGINSIDRNVIFKPNSTMRGNLINVTKAIVVEWGIAWGLYEVAFLVSRWIGVRWFGYKRL